MSHLETFPSQSAAQLSLHLKSLRKLKGLTQAQLGERIGVKQARITDIERDPGAVSVDQIIALLHALDARLRVGRPYPAAPGTPRVARESGADW